MFWAGVMLLMGTSLMSGHWVTMPHPELSDSKWTGQIQEQIRQSSTSKSESLRQWNTLHVLYANCPCSMQVANEILSGPPEADVKETIVLVGNDADLEKRAQSLGFQFESLTQEGLKLKYGLEAAPCLLITTREYRPCYIGGYTSRKRGPDNQYKTIIRALKNGQVVDSYPIFGCAISKSLQQEFDPLGIKSFAGIYESEGAWAQ